MTSIFGIMTIYLAAMITVATLSARLGTGSVLGYLAAGLLIGPILGVAGAEAETLQHFAEFGVVMMLFLIGLEFEPAQLWAMRRQVFGLGGAQVVLTTLLFSLLLMSLGQAWQVAIAIGMTLSLSSTAIVMQTMHKKRISHTTGAKSVFSVLLSQDILVIGMLVILPLLSKAPPDEAEEITGSVISGLPGWATAVITVVAVLFVVYAGRNLVRPIARFVHRAKLREMDAALALLIVVAISAIMSAVGLSPALGAFLAGMMLAGSELRHEMESHIEPYKGLLLGLFFVSVGANMNLNLLVELPLVILTCVFFTVLLKGLTLNLVARVFRLRQQDRMLLTLSLAQAGEFGFVMVSYAGALRILDKQTSEGTELIITLSMLITPLLFLLHEKAVKTLKHSRPSYGLSDQEAPAIIIAGLGRFGRIVNNVALAAQTKTVLLDSNPETVNTARKYGMNAFFGDPQRPSILKTAGILTTEAIAVCVDDKDTAINVVREAKRLNPLVRVIARAHDTEHVLALRKAGADEVFLEVFESALGAASAVLRAVGVDADEAGEAIEVYRDEKRESVERLYHLWQPDEKEQKQEFVQERERAQNRFHNGINGVIGRKAGEAPS